LKNFTHLTLLFLFGIIVISSGCYNPSSGGPIVTKKIPTLSDTGLSGTSWQWLYSIGGWTGHDSSSPYNSGYNLKIQFTDDSLFGYFRNDTLIETAHYHVFLGDSTEYYPWQISFKDISLTKFNRGFGSYGEISSIEVSVDTLTIVANTTETYAETYILIQ
jgi:hypothetical protein